MEEGNIEILEPPVLHGLFFNSRVSHRDHVAVFVVRSFRQARVPVPDREIAAHGFFSLDALPENATPSTRARIAEVMLGAPFQNGGDEMVELARQTAKELLPAASKTS